MTEVSIEPAKPEDAKVIMTLKRDAWLQTYPNKEAGVTVEDIRKKFTDEDLAQGIKNWQGGIAIEKPGGDRAAFVAKIDGKVVGYTSLCTEDGKRMLGAMYVAPTAQGRGVGSELIKKAIKWHGRDQNIYLHVVDYNDKAIGFYEHFGFRKTGVEIPEDTDENGHKLQREFEMVLKAK